MKGEAHVQPKRKSRYFSETTEPIDINLARGGWRAPQPE